MIISPQQSDDAQIVSFVVVPVFGTPLTRNGRFADAASTPTTLNSQFLKDLPSEIAVFGFHFSYLAIPAHTFSADLLHNSSIFP